MVCSVPDVETVLERRVVAGGMRVLHDPDGLLAALVAAC
jgi:hypothetical protein